MKQKTISILLTILMSMVGTKAFAYDIEVENADGVMIYYNYINDGAELEVTIGWGYEGNIVIPDEVTYMGRTRKVTSIGESAFNHSNALTSVTIGNNVTSIGESAFYCCNHLASVTIGNSVTSIGRWAFGESGLLSISLPNSLTSIGEYAFENCVGLTSITIPNSVTDIGKNAFYECQSLTSITIPNKVTNIQDWSFCKCYKLSSVTIPNSVTRIGESAFNGCQSLTSITIPNSVTSIENSAFYDSDILNVISQIENPFEISDWAFSKNTFYNATLYVPEGTIDKYKATAGWKKFNYIQESSPSGILDVKGDGTNEIQRYTLDGKIIKNSHKGINIIKMENGTTKKVLVK